MPIICCTIKLTFPLPLPCPLSSPPPSPLPRVPGTGVGRQLQQGSEGEEDHSASSTARHSRRRRARFTHQGHHRRWRSAPLSLVPRLNPTMYLYIHVSLTCTYTYALYSFPTTACVTCSHPLHLISCHPCCLIHVLLVFFGPELICSPPFRCDPVHPQVSGHQEGEAAINTVSIATDHTHTQLLYIKHPPYLCYI